MRLVTACVIGLWHLLVAVVGEWRQRGDALYLQERDYLLSATTGLACTHSYSCGGESHNHCFALFQRNPEQLISLGSSVSAPTGSDWMLMNTRQIAGEQDAWALVEIRTGAIHRFESFVEAKAAFTKRNGAEPQLLSAAHPPDTIPLEETFASHARRRSTHFVVVLLGLTLPLGILSEALALIGLTLPLGRLSDVLESWLFRGRRSA